MEVIPMNNKADRIFDLLKAKGIRQKDFADLLGVTDKKVSAWSTGRSKTYTDYLPQIADILGTTVEYLMTGDQKEKPALPMESELDEELVTRLTSLTPEERKQVDAFVKGLLASR